MTKQQCQECKSWFEDEDLDAHLQGHLREAAEEPAKERPLLRCPLCGGTEFDRETGYLKKSFSFGGHNLVLAICRQCHFIIQFYAGKTFFGVWGEGKSNYSEIRDALESGRTP
jgi:hypothetical protein